MNINAKKDELIDVILKDAHSQIQPPDSWEAFRGRIEDRIYGGDMPSISITRLGKDAAFWRRMTLAMAACLVITLALLIYILGYSGGNWRQETATDGRGLLSQAQLHQLSTAFSHVRQLFGRHCPWMVVDSGGEGEIGVDNQTIETAVTNKVIVVRLAVNVENQKATPLYLDVVTFSDQQVSFRTPLADDLAIDVSLKPVLTNVGKIVVEIKARLDDGSQAGGVMTVADNVFTSLVRVRSNSSWVNIDAVARSVSNI